MEKFCDEEKVLENFTRLRRDSPLGRKKFHVFVSRQEAFESTCWQAERQRLEVWFRRLRTGVPGEGELGVEQNYRGRKALWELFFCSYPGVGSRCSE